MASRTAVRTFDYLVIGGGSGGLGSGRRASLLGAKVGLIEHGRLGGTCVSLAAVVHIFQYHSYLSAALSYIYVLVFTFFTQVNVGCIPKKVSTLLCLLSVHA